MRLAALVTIAFLAAACGKQEEPVAPPPAQVAPVPMADPAPVEPQAVGASCSQDCGGGNVASITCAEGETPVCDCAATPKAACKVAESAAP